MHISRLFGTHIGTRTYSTSGVRPSAWDLSSCFRHLHPSRSSCVQGKDCHPCCFRYTCASSVRSTWSCGSLFGALAAYWSGGDHPTRGKRKEKKRFSLISGSLVTSTPFSFLFVFFLRSFFGTEHEHGMHWRGCSSKLLSLTLQFRLFSFLSFSFRSSPCIITENKTVNGRMIALS